MEYGILGSGQLAWMLGLAAKAAGHGIRLIDPSLSQVAKQREALLGCDWICFESEFLDFENWREALSESRVYPSLALMEKLSDKWEQKQLAAQFDIPMAKAELYSGGEAPRERKIAKWSRQGYDGYGNFALGDSLDESKWRNFCVTAEQRNAKIYLEDFVDFDAECSLLIARDIQGSLLSYPLFLTEQSRGVCNWVWGPASEYLPHVESVLKTLLPKIHAFLEQQEYVGVIAFEFFWVKNRLLLNEIAPRVHNSAHITLDAFNISQFDLHLRAPVGFEDSKICAKTSHYAMKNLLGRESTPCASGAQRVPGTEGDGQVEETLYWYGKAESRPGRKMGHLNLLFENETRDEIRARMEEREEEVWQRYLEKGP